jgi:hypothetical protein
VYRASGYPSLAIQTFASPASYIEDIADRLWERLHWEIGDYEGNDLHFYCDSISILSVTLLDKGEHTQIARNRD